MSKVVLRGEEALRYAERHDVPLHMTGHGKEDDTVVDLERAREVAAEHPSRVWIEVEEGVNTAED